MNDKKDPSGIIASLYYLPADVKDALDAAATEAGDSNSKYLEGLLRDKFGLPGKKGGKNTDRYSLTLTLRQSIGEVKKVFSHTVSSRGIPPRFIDWLDQSTNQARIRVKSKVTAEKKEIHTDGK